MGSPGPNGAVSSMIRILRKATRIVQIAPFAYLAVYAVYMLSSPFASEKLLSLADSFITITPLATCLMLVASHLFKLCNWHKTACLIPTGSQVEGFIDSFVITLTQQEVIIINTALGIASVTFLFFAIRHFFYGGRNRH